MKKKIFLSLVLFLFAGSAFAQSGWQWMNPKPVGSHLEDCFFLTENTGFSVGWDGVIIKTTNGGINWMQQNSGGNYFLKSVYFINPNTGYIVSGDEEGLSSNAVLLKTTNSGINWNKQTTLNSLRLWDVYFENELTGFVCGGINYNYGIIYKTTDGGENWNSSQFQNLSPYINSLHFIDSNTGFAAGDNSKIYKTTNGGIQWVTINLGAIGDFNSLYFLNSLTGFVATSAGKILKTTDSGVNWSQNYSNENMEFRNIKFSNSNFGVAVAGSSWGNNLGFTVRTTNSGNTWDSVYNGSNFNLRGLSLINNSIYEFGYWGGIFKSTNFGSNWMSINNNESNSNFYDVTFSDVNSGYVLGQSGILMKTINSGESWSTLNLNTTVALTDIEIIDNSNAFVCGDLGFLSKTSNGGMNWSTINSGTNTKIDWIKFPTVNIGYLNAEGTLSDPVVLKKTTDNGNSWFKLMNILFTGSFFIDQNTGYLSKAPSLQSTKLLKTTNGFETWSESTIPYRFEINSMYFISSLTGFAAGRSISPSPVDYLLVKTTDGGVSWERLNINADYDFEIQSIYFTNSLTGYIACLSFPDYGRAGDIFKSTDGGNSWTHISSTSAMPTIQRRALNSIYFLNNQTGFIVGEKGLILKTTTGGNVFVSQISSIIPDKYSLSQNYPNPFNPSTRINYELKITNYVSLKVFNALGKEVATLVNEKQNAGSYAVDFNSSEFSLPSGIYFYTLNAGEFTETRKMVLVK